MSSHALSTNLNEKGFNLVWSFWMHTLVVLILLFVMILLACLIIVQVKASTDLKLGLGGNVDDKLRGLKLHVEAFWYVLEKKVGSIVMPILTCFFLIKYIYCYNAFKCFYHHTKSKLKKLEFFIQKHAFQMNNRSIFVHHSLTLNWQN